MKKRLGLLTGFVLGIVIIVVSFYLYFFAQKTVFSSSESNINSPLTSVKRSITLKENDSPHNIYLDISYSVISSPKTDNLRLLNYKASLSYDMDDIIEQKSSSLNLNLKENGFKTNTIIKESINLFKLKTLPSGNYKLSLELKPEENTNNQIKLELFSYRITSEAVFIHPVVPLTGLALASISVFFLFNKGSLNKSA